MSLEKGLQKHQLTHEEVSDLLMGETEDLIPILEKFSPGEYYNHSFSAKESTAAMQDYLDQLREHGLDIGKGNAEFGYKMPLPKEGAPRRDLIIFRRRY